MQHTAAVCFTSTFGVCVAAAGAAEVLCAASATEANATMTVARSQKVSECNVAHVVRVTPSGVAMRIIDPVPNEVFDCSVVVNH